MIDPIESPSKLVTLAPGVGIFVNNALGSFTAPEDLTLRQARFTMGDNAAYSAWVTTDPDQSQVDPNTVATSFQLVATVDQSTSAIPQLIVFENLSFPLVKGQTLYMGGSGRDTIQLIFS